MLPSSWVNVADLSGGNKILNCGNVLPVILTTTHLQLNWLRRIFPSPAGPLQDICISSTRVRRGAKVGYPKQALQMAPAMPLQPSKFLLRRSSENVQEQQTFYLLVPTYTTTISSTS